MSKRSEIESCSAVIRVRSSGLLRGFQRLEPSAPPGFADSIAEEVRSRQSILIEADANTQGIELMLKCRLRLNSRPHALLPLRECHLR